jgi:hypothetical protein
MPRLQIDYSNTIIYKLVCRNLDIKNCYVGHTTQFTKRKYGHKLACDGTHKMRYVHRFINENGGFSNWDMVMIEKYSCKDVYEACARERFYIEQLNADLNKYSPPTGLTTSEYGKQYRKKNPEKCKELSKQYYTKHTDKIKEKCKQYYIENSEKCKEIVKQYSTEHVDKIKEYKSTRFCCIICRVEMRRDCLTRHYKALHNND